MSHTRASQHRRTPLPRVLGLDANPLRRTSDRIQAWIRIGFVLVFLISAPLAAVLVGRWSEATTLSAARAHQAAIHSLTATVTRAVPDTNPDPSRGMLAWTQATWKAPDGATRRGEVQAPLGARAGAKVRIWVDRAGRITEPPLTRGQVLSRMITAVALTPVAIGLLLALVFGLAARVIERRHLQLWERAWAAIEPQWTRRLR